MTTLESLRIGEDRLFGVEVTHKDRSKDWYDPLTEDGVRENETEYLFNNGFYTYNEPKDAVAELRRYEICQVCKFPVEKCHCPNTQEQTT